MTTAISPALLPDTVPADLTTGRQSVMMRYDPCRCGCKGRDPWHARMFQRVVRNVETQSPELVFSNEYLSSYIVATGVIKHPSGSVRVKLKAYVTVDGRAGFSCWTAYSI